MGVLDLRGPEFLIFYSLLLAVVGGGAVLLRELMRPPWGRGDADTEKAALSLRPEEVGYLAGGEEQALQSAIAALAQRDLLAVDSSKGTLTLKGAPPADVDTLERRLCAVFGKDPRTIRSLTLDAKPLLAPVRARLIRLGLLLTDGDRSVARLLPAVLVGGVALLGFAKIAIGISRHRPVTFLVILVGIAVFAMVQLYRNAPERSRRGDRVLERLRGSSTGLELTVKSKPDRLAPLDLALAVGMFGPAVMSAGPLSALGMTLAPAPVTKKSWRFSGGWSADSGGISSCSSSCGGGSCGGGCGGGGCGGCGGS